MSGLVAVAACSGLPVVLWQYLASASVSSPSSASRVVLSWREEWELDLRRHPEVFDGGLDVFGLPKGDGTGLLRLCFWA